MKRLIIALGVLACFCLRTYCANMPELACQKDKALSPGAEICSFSFYEPSYEGNNPKGFIPDATPNVHYRYLYIGKSEGIVKIAVTVLTNRKNFSHLYTLEVPANAGSAAFNVNHYKIGAYEVFVKPADDFGRIKVTQVVKLEVSDVPAAAVKQ